MTPFIIGVAGGTGSGKTTVSRHIQQAVGDRQNPPHLAYLQHDSYYRDDPNWTWEQRVQQNYDHPDSLETFLLISHLQQLRAGQAVEVPRYDFSIYRRLEQTQRVEPSAVVLVEGILIFAEKALRELMDMRIFVDADADIRFIRRLQRDVHARGRDLNSIIQQYLSTVRPMHLEFVEPSKRYADIIIPEGGENRVAMEMIVSRVRSILEARG